MRIIQTVSVCPSVLREKKNHLSFVNISPTLVINASIGKVFEYYTMETQKFDFFFPRSSKLNLTCAEELKSTFK